MKDTSKFKLPRFNLEVASTPNCNMACTYCFEGEELKSKSKQTLENLDLIMDKINDLLNSSEFCKKYSGITVNFWGGEPTINYEWNKKLIDKIREEHYIFKGLVDFFIYTNGFDYLKVKKHIDLFSKEELQYNRLRIQISYDGIGNNPTERVDHKGKETSARVRNNIITLALIYPELSIKTKATIQPQDIPYIKTVWLDYMELFKTIFDNQMRNPLWNDKEKIEIFKKNPSKTEISFSPTINYLDDFDTSPEYLEEIQKAFEEIARYELAFYKKYHRHLFSWFGGKTITELNNKRSTNCSAGVNILLLDVEGNASVCHGTLYSPLKEEFKKFTNTNIKDTKFVDKFFQTRNELEKSLTRMDPSCKNCEATVCYKCPIINVEQEHKNQSLLASEDSKDSKDLNYISENFQKRDPRHCGIYKTFGPIDKALYALKEEIKWQTN